MKKRKIIIVFCLSFVFIGCKSPKEKEIERFAEIINKDLPDRIEPQTVLLNAEILKLNYKSWYDPNLTRDSINIRDENHIVDIEITPEDYK